MRRLLFVILLACRPSVDANDACAPTVLASIPAHQIYIDDQRIVFYQYLGDLRTCPRDACDAPTTLMTLTGEEARFVVDSGNVYVSRTTGRPIPARIERCALAGCSAGATPIVPQEVTTDFTIDRGFIYYGASTQGGGEIRRCPIEGCGSTPTTLVTSPKLIGSFLLYETVLYWTTDDGTFDCPVSGCNSPVQLVAGDHGRLVAVDAQDVYYATASYKTSTVLRCSISGCVEPEELVSGYSLRLGFDNENLYYEDFPPPRPLPIRRMSKRLGAAVDVADPGYLGVGSNFVFDEQCIYWSDARSIRRAPK